MTSDMPHRYDSGGLGTPVRQGRVEFQHRPSGPEMSILVLCTANVCRSVIAAAFLGQRLADLGIPAAVRSAGFLRAGSPPLWEVVSLMARCGYDVSSHRSRVVRAAELATADLVVCLERAHVRRAVAAVPGAWPRCFTLKELVRRGDLAGARPLGEPLPGWLHRLQQGRTRAGMLGNAPDDDVTDPAGGPMPAYAGTVAVIDDLVLRFCRLCWGQRAYP